MIHTIIFDIGRVLVEFDWPRFVHSLCPEEETAKAVAEAFFQNGYWKEMDRGVMPIDEILQGYISNAPQYEEQIRHIFSNLGGCVEQFHYAKDWIRRLRHRGYQVFYLSNYSEYLIECNPTALDFIPLMDGGVFSCRAKSIKPDRKIYDMLCSTYGLNPGECVFIDDTEENIAAAEEYGIQGIVFTSYEQADADLEALLSARA